MKQGTLTLRAQRQAPETDSATVRVERRGASVTAPLAAAALAAHHTQFVVVGGCALFLRSESERCSDLDIVPLVDDENLERPTTALHCLTHEPLVIRADDRIASVRSPYGRIDVCIATGREEFDELDARADVVLVANTPVRVATTEDTLRLRARFEA